MCHAISGFCQKDGRNDTVRPLRALARQSCPSILDCLKNKKYVNSLNDQHFAQATVDIPNNQIFICNQ